MKAERPMRFSTAAIHAGQSPDPTTGAIMTPVYLTSTYVQDGPGAHKGYEYSRTGNPTRTALESNLAALEGGRHGLAYASGCAAASNLMHLLSPGDHVVSCDDLYGGTFRLFESVYRPMGIEFTFADLSDASRLPALVRPRTRMVWIESPTNPLLKLIDIAAVAKGCRERGIRVVVDNTFATPALQRPLELGADVVVHSTTKYLNGHSDVVGGAIVLDDEATWEKLKFLQNAIGATPSPFDCFLVLRGIKTLPVRMDRHGDNAARIAAHLEKSPDVERVVYPGLASHAQHALAARQMRGPGGMITFDLRGDLERARRFLKATRIFACAESLGGVESLIEHPALMTHASVPPETRKALGIGDGLIRLSVGLEDADDLIADLDQAFVSSRQKAGSRLV